MMSNNKYHRNSNLEFGRDLDNKITQQIWSISAMPLLRPPDLSYDWSAHHHFLTFEYKYCDQSHESSRHDTSLHPNYRRNCCIFLGTWTWNFHYIVHWSHDLPSVACFLLQALLPWYASAVCGFVDCVQSRKFGSTWRMDIRSLYDDCVYYSCAAELTFSHPIGSCTNGIQT